MRISKIQTPKPLKMRKFCGILFPAIHGKETAMKKKKVNPNKMPLGNQTIDTKNISGQISDRITLLAWAEVLGALADFPYTTQEEIWDLWHNTNKAAGVVHRHTDVEIWIEKLESLAGIHLPYAKVSSANIYTQGDLNRFIRKTERNALSSAYAIIARPLVERELLPLQDIQKIFQKAVAFNSEIEEKRISVKDIQEMLEEELRLQLAITSTGVKLAKLE